MSTMNVQEVSRILDLPVARIRRIVQSHPEFRSHRAGGGGTRRFTATDLEILRKILIPNEIDTTSPPEQETELKFMPDTTSQLNVESPVNELFRNDVVRAVYAGGRRQEAALDALRGQIRQEARKMVDDQHLVLGTILAQMKAEFAEMKTKLDRHGRMIEDLQVSHHAWINRLKKSENLQEIRKSPAPQPVAAPLTWHERLFFGFFQPWKLRGRI